MPTKKINNFQQGDIANAEKSHSLFSGTAQS